MNEAAYERKPVSFRLRSGIKARMQAKARADGKSLNEVANVLLEQALSELTILTILNHIAMNVEWLIQEVRGLRERNQS